MRDNQGATGRKLKTGTLLVLLAWTCGHAFVTFEHEWGWYGNSYGYTVDQTADQGYIMGAFVQTGIGQYTMSLIRADSLGDTLWVKSFPNYAGGYACATRDGGYAITGAVDVSLVEKLHALKTNALGDTLSSYVSPFSGYPRAIIGTSDSGFAVCGSNNDVGAFCLLKFDRTGAETRVTNYPDSVTGSLAPNEVVQTRDGGFVLCGVSAPTDTSRFCLFKTDSLGSMLWQHTYGLNTAGLSVCETPDSGYLAVGAVFEDSPTLCVLRTDSVGDSLWCRVIGPAGATSSEAVSVRSCRDSGYIVAGWIRNANREQVYLLKLAASGDSLWSSTLGSDSFDVAADVRPTLDRGYAIVGNADLQRVLLLKTDTLGRILGGIAEEQHSSRLSLSLTPNPAARFVTAAFAIPTAGRASVEMYDANGRLVRTLFTGTAGPGGFSADWDSRDARGAQVAGGVYFCTLTFQDSRLTRKLTLIQ
jgi:hypothetical protein